jgi:hypothetical protein
VVEFAGGTGDGPEAREELVSANFVRITRSQYSGRGHSDPLDPTIYNTGCDAMHNREQILVKVRCYGETRSPVRPGRPVMITKGIGVLNIWHDE